MGFHDRAAELEVLQRFHSRPGLQLLPVYGRRRVGKTTLLRRFLEGKRGLYFLCRQVSERVQLTALGRAVGEAFDDSFLEERGFGAWDQVFDYLARQAGHSAEKLVVVFDEYPYLTASTTRTAPGWCSFRPAGSPRR